VNDTSDRRAVSKKIMSAARHDFELKSAFDHGYVFRPPNSTELWMTSLDTRIQYGNANASTGAGSQSFRSFVGGNPGGHLLFEGEAEFHELRVQQAADYRGHQFCKPEVSTGETNRIGSFTISRFEFHRGNNAS